MSEEYGVIQVAVNNRLPLESVHYESAYVFYRISEGNLTLFPVKTEAKGVNAEPDSDLYNKIKSYIEKREEVEEQEPKVQRSVDILEQKKRSMHSLQGSICDMLK